jgi:hypothetical protein
MINIHKNTKKPRKRKFKIGFRPNMKNESKEKGAPKKNIWRINQSQKIKVTILMGDRIDFKGIQGNIQMKKSGKEKGIEMKGRRRGLKTRIKRSSKNMKTELPNQEAARNMIDNTKGRMIDLENKSTTK